jgi:hypothetical protein
VIALIVIASVAVYFFGVGITYPLIEKTIGEGAGTHPGTFLATLGWPFALFVIIGARITRRIESRRTVRQLPEAKVVQRG